MLITNYTTATHQAQVNQNYELRITPSSPKSLDWFIVQFQSIRNLLAFLVGYRIETISIGYKAESTEQDISIILPPESASIDTISNSEMLMPLSRLRNDLKVVLDNWFDKKRKLEILSELSLGVIYKVHQSRRFEFLALVQALERYHQVACPGCKEENIEMTKKCKQKIMRDCTIRTRISQLHQNLPEASKEYAQFDEDTLKSIIHTRNYYTHYSSKYRKTALKGAELKRTNLLLLRLIFLILYCELGISEEKISESFCEGWYNPTLLLGMSLSLIL